MNKYFLSTVKYDKTAENGMIKNVSEQYLFDALSYTEAESRTIEELTPYISGEFSITDIKQPRISELTPYISGEFSITDIKQPRISELMLDGESDRYYRFTVMFVTIDEKTAVEKKTKSFMIVQARDFDHAVERFNECMKGTMADYEVVAVAETPIVDYFPVKAAE